VRLFSLLTKNFVLSRNVYFVRGANRGAIYDLNSGKIYSIDSVGAHILDFVIKEGLTLLKAAYVLPTIKFGVVIGFLNTLVNQGLGKWERKDVSLLGEKIDLDFSSFRSNKLNSIIFELTRRCNLHCIHCLVESAHEINNEELQTADWKRLIDEAYALGCRNIGFGGGEPLLIKEFPKLIAYAQEKGLHVDIFTNATLFRPTLLNVLKSTRIHVSLYGPSKDIHDRITRVPGSFLATVKAIEKLKAHGAQLWISMAVMEENKDYVEETEEFVKKSLNIDKFSAALILPIGRGCSNPLTFETFIHKMMPQQILSPKLLKAITQGKIKCVCFRDKPAFPLIDRDTWVRLHSGTCWSNGLYITSTGDILPCSAARQMILGNVRQPGSLKSVVLSEAVQHLWGLTKDCVLVCRDCEYRYACIDCWVMVSKETGSIYNKPPWCTYDPYAGEWRSTYS